MMPKIAEGDANKVWIIPSELTDALRGIGGALGATKPGADGDDDGWVEPEQAISNAFEETTLADPATALAEARGQAAQSSKEAEEHAQPASRVQPPVRPGVDAVPPRQAPPARPRRRPRRRHGGAHRGPLSPFADSDTGTPGHPDIGCPGVRR